MAYIRKYDERIVLAMGMPMNVVAGILTVLYVKESLGDMADYINPIR